MKDAWKIQSFQFTSINNRRVHYSSTAFSSTISKIRLMGGNVENKKNIWISGTSNGDWHFFRTKWRTSIKEGRYLSHPHLQYHPCHQTLKQVKIYPNNISRKKIKYFTRFNIFEEFSKAFTYSKRILGFFQLINLDQFSHHISSCVFWNCGGCVECVDRKNPIRSVNEFADKLITGAQSRRLSHVYSTWLAQIQGWFNLCHNPMV